MEYFLGSMITLLVMFITTRMVLPHTFQNSKTTIRYSQSHIFEIMRPLLPPPNSIERPKKRTQSSNYADRTNIRVVVIDSLAYWVKDNIFYVADMDGMDIQKDTARVVDTMNMDKVQLDKMLFIMDQLRDGKENDSGSSGNK